MSDTSAGSSSSKPRRLASQRIVHFAVNALIALSIIYAFLAGFRTVYDLDLGWQLATGRWVIQHHQIPSTDVLSYTAQGNSWIYPVLSGLIFYGLYLLGGYAALSWMTATAMALTCFLITRQRNFATAILALIAVPVLAHRVLPRSDMFSTVLFAAFLSILWHYHRRGSGPLWLLPLLSAAWVNLHLGFVVGLLLCVAYVAIEAAESIFAGRRAAAIERVRRAWPWLAASVAATVINPWGPRIFVALLRQQEAMKTHSMWIREWAGLRITWTAIEDAFAWRQPSGDIWWLLIAAFVAVIAAVFLRQAGAVLLLLGSALLTIQHIRFEAMFASIVVVVGGCVLADGVAELRRLNRWPEQYRVVLAATITVVVVFAGLAGVRVYDLVSNRLYLRTTSESLFGTGLSWWFPERALAFVEREHLPRNVFNDYDLGGYLTWRLPQYPDYIDGRAIPFGSEQFKRAVYVLPEQAPDSPEWQKEAEDRGIYTIIVSIANTIERFPNLRAFCESQSWRPVYLDEVSAVFVRQTPETKSLIERLQINCSTAAIVPPAPSIQKSRMRADEFNFWLSSAVLLSNLDRGEESSQALERAQAIFPDNSNVHLLRGVALMDRNLFREAETEIHHAIDLQPDQNNLSALARLLVAERRYTEAVQAVRNAAELSPHPQNLYLELGQLYLQIRQPRQALEAFDSASRSDIFAIDSGSLGADFHAKVAGGSAIAWWAVGDKTRAIQMQEQAANYTPQNLEVWKRLAAMYQAVGRIAEAQQSLSRAQVN